MILVRTLGMAQIDAESTSILPASPRRFAFLLYLAAENGRRVPRSVLRELIFPDQAETNARHSLRELTYQFRQIGVCVASDMQGLALPQLGVSFDYDELLTTGTATTDALRAVEGGFLPGYAPDFSDSLTEWLDAYRARSALALCKPLVAILDRARQDADWSAVERCARACLGLDPLNEEATFALAEAYATSGAKARALDLLDRYAEDVGKCSERLQLPVKVLKHRISERLRDSYKAPISLPFVGRDAEIRKLSECLDRSRAGKSVCAVLCGDPGIGKSRIAEEFCKRASLDGAFVATAGSQPHDAHRPMGAVAGLVQRLLQLPGALGCSPNSMAALQLLIKPELGDAASFQQMPSEAVSASILRANADLIDAIASEAPLILLLDDAQWADELSLKTLALLASTQRHRRLLVILAGRDRGLGQRIARSAERCVPIRVGPLLPASTDALVARIAGTDSFDMDEELQNWLAFASGGNPFFLQCLIAHFQATGERFAVPTSISALLDQQLAGLSHQASIVLAAVVALGRHSTAARLVAALDLPFIELQEAVRELETANLIARQEAHVEPAHCLVAESVARTTPPIASVLLHRRVATLLEEDAGLAPSTAAWECAEHWILAGEHSRASSLMGRCATYSMEIGRPREAAETLLRAAALVDGQERSDLLTRAIQLAATIVQDDLVLRGADLAHRCGVRVGYCGFQLDLLLAQIRGWDDPARAEDALRQWLTPDRDRRDRLKAGVEGLILADNCADAEFAHEVYSSLAEVLSSPSQGDDPTALKVLLIYHSRFGDIAQSVRLAHQLLQHASGGPPIDAADLQRKAAVALCRAGSIDEAIAACQRAFESARTNGLISLQCAIASMLAGMMIEIGDLDSHFLWVRQVEELADNVHGFRTSLTYITMLADAASSTGNPEMIRRWVDAGRDALQGRQGDRASRWLRALDTRARFLEGRQLDADAVVQDMLLHHRLDGEAGDLGDLEVAVAIEALYGCGRIIEAGQLLTRYVTAYRRTPGPLAVNLRRVASLIDWRPPIADKGQKGDAPTRADVAC